MNKKQKINFKYQLNKLFKVIFISLIILLIYGIGMSRGIIKGIDLVQKKNNKSVCDFLIENSNNSKIEKENEICILSKEAKYTQYASCDWGIIKVEGNKTMGFFLNIAQIPKKILSYHIIGCW